MIIDPKLNIAYIRHMGSIRVEGFISLVMELVCHPLYAPGINVLYDYRFANFDAVTTTDMETFSGYLQRQRKDIYNQVAIVVGRGQDLSISYLWQSVSIHLAHKRKVFQSMSKGESWLFSNSTPGIKSIYLQTDAHLESIKNKRNHHVIDKTGQILKSSVKSPLDEMPLQGRNISEILHVSYAYPLACMLRKVLKTKKKAWITLRVGTHDFAERIMTLDNDRAYLEEYDISGMGAYEIERLKWEVDENQRPHRTWSTDVASFMPLPTGP